MTAVDAQYAAKFISEWQPQSETLRKKLRQPFLFLADEFFLKAGLSFPAIKEYGDFPQIENGVGMVPLFMKEAAQLLKRVRPIKHFRATAITGVSSFGFVSAFICQLAEKCGVDLIPVSVENRLFGESVTVSGLVGGNDIVAALKGCTIGSCLLLPDVMLKEGEDVFLDDVSLAELEQRLGSRVIVFDSTPVGFYKALRSFKR